MAVYDKETKFYWLQLKEDFFDEDAIQWLEEQQPNGKEYAYFYLKLCVKSLFSRSAKLRISDATCRFRRSSPRQITM